MQRGKHTSSSQPSSRTLSAILMTFFPEKSTFILQSAAQPLLQRLPLQSRPLSLTTEPSLNPNPSPRPLKYRPQHSPHKHEPQQKPQQLVVLKACPALGHLLIVPRWRRSPLPLAAPLPRALLRHQLICRALHVGRAQRKLRLTPARRRHWLLHKLQQQARIRVLFLWLQRQSGRHLEEPQMSAVLLLPV